MYDIETIKAHCPFAVNFDKIDRDLSKIGMSMPITARMVASMNMLHLL